MWQLPLSNTASELHSAVRCAAAFMTCTENTQSFLSCQLPMLRIMPYSQKRIAEVAEVKRAAVRRIRAAIRDIHTLPSHKYIEDFTSEFAGYQDVCNAADILDEASAANLIWIGDYHVLSRFQEFAANFVRQLYQRNPNIALGVEPVFARHQKVLDRWMQDRISERTFLETIRYDEEWGCDWNSYSTLFRTARELKIPVYGVDCHPRYDMRSIGRRDHRISRRIAGIIERDLSRTLVVVFGESHLASAHLPSRLRAMLGQRGISRQELLILQNVDEIYWKVQKRGLENVRAVRLRPRQYCVLNSTPIEKYESFRQYLHKCIDEDDTGVWTQFVHGLIDFTMAFVELKRDANALEAFPRVYPEVSPAELPLLLARLAVPVGRARLASDQFQENGTSYVPELNSIFIHRLQLASAAEESTRFVHRWSRGDVPFSLDRPPGDQFFVTVIERALGYFCSKLLDSSRDGIEVLAQRVLSQIAWNDQLVRAVSSLSVAGRRPAAQHFETLRLAIAGGNRNAKTSHMLGQLLGYALGRKLYGAYLETRISRKDLRGLFRDPLGGLNEPFARYREWSERLSS